MRIKILGARAENPVEHPRIRLHSSIAVFWRAKVLQFDAGNHFPETKLKPDALFITHSHPDHNAFAREFSCPVFFQRGAEISGLKIQPFPVKHSFTAPAVGFSIQSPHRKAIYLPDVLSLTSEARREMRAADLWLIDGSSFSKDIRRKTAIGEVGHASIKTIFSWARRLKPKKICFIHIGREPARRWKEVQDFLKSSPVPARLGVDGVKLEV